MRLQRWKVGLVLAGMLVGSGLASLAIGQVIENPFDRRVKPRRAAENGAATNRSAADADVPRAALLTDRGRQLADRLRHLRRAAAGMGAKHPSLSGVQEEIAEVKKQLAAWSPDRRVGGVDVGKPLDDAVPEMSGHDVRQLVLRLSAKIDRLERRIDTLERRAGNQ